MIGGSRTPVALIITAICCIISILSVHTSANDNLRVAYQWKEIDFEFPTAAERQEAIASKRYIPENVIPVGLEVYKKRLFLTLPRWKEGIPASLGYINLNETTTQSPRLHPYPSWSAHKRSSSETEAPEIVSPFRIRADRCGRLWVLDTGVEELLGNATVTSPTSLLVYDLHNDNLLRRYKFPADHLKENSFYANIAVEDTDCDDTYAYAADLGSPGLVVYSWKQQESWRVKHHFFYPDPLAGNYNITGINFQWDDGLFGIALKPQSDGYATLYFHPLSSLNEFSVSTKVLRNQTYATDPSNYHEFKILGSRGPNGQAGVAFVDQKTGVIFYALPNLNAITCWKTSNRAYTIKSLGRVYMSTVDMVFPNDVKVDDESNLWVLSDRMHQYMYESLNRNDINFRVLTATVKDAIQNTACDTNIKPLPDIITNLGDILRPSTSTVAPKVGSGGVSVLHFTSSAMALFSMISMLLSSNYCCRI